MLFEDLVDVGKREVSLMLDEYAEGQEIQQMKREQQRRLQREHRQTQPKKNGTIRSANKISGSAFFDALPLFTLYKKSMECSYYGAIIIMDFYIRNAIALITY